MLLFLKNSLIKLKFLIHANKIDLNNFVLVSATDDAHFQYAENLVKNYKKFSHIFERLIIYDLGLCEKNKQALAKNGDLELRKFEFSNYPEFFSFRLDEHNNKIGGFAWKPAILNLIYMERTYKKVVWLDSACLFNKKIKYFKYFTVINGFASFFSSGTIKDWTYSSVLENNNLKEKNLVNSKNLMGGVLGFDFENHLAVSLLENWFKMCLKKPNIFPVGSSIKNHRHDQSILSICYWQLFKVNLLTGTKYFGIYIQNWPDKFLYFFDSKKKYENELNKKFLMRSTTTNSRAKIMILFNVKNLEFIPFYLLFRKKIIVFIEEENELMTFKKFRFRKYFVKVYVSNLINYKNSSQIEFNLRVINQVIEKEYQHVAKGKSN